MCCQLASWQMEERQPKPKCVSKLSNSPKTEQQLQFTRKSYKQKIGTGFDLRHIHKKFPWVKGKSLISSISFFKMLEYKML